MKTWFTIAMFFFIGFCCVFTQPETHRPISNVRFVTVTEDEFGVENLEYHAENKIIPLTTNFKPEIEFTVISLEGDVLTYRIDGDLGGSYMCVMKDVNSASNICEEIK